jgi:hypothetical protein
MNRKLLGLAVSATLGVAAGSVNAAPLTFGVDTPQLDFYMSGASAQDPGIRTLFGQLCNRGTGPGSATDTMTLYTGPSNQAAIFCKASGITGIANGTNILFHKSSVGGSGNGGKPVAAGTALAFMNQNSTCPAPVFDAVDQRFESTCTVNATTSIAPDAGASDVEPRLLLPALSAPEAGNISPRSAYAIPFGVPVTLKLYRALQDAQGLVVGADDEANTPSLSKAQLASLYAGNVTTWDFLRDEEGFGLNSINDANNDGTNRTAPASPNVFLARRVETSGTQASFEIYFLNARCTTIGPMPAPNDGGNVTSGGGTCGTNTVNAGSGSGNVISCLNTLDSQSKWGVGVLSMEYSPTANDGFKFIKINGVSGSALNMTEGRYDFVMENTFQWRTSGANVLAGDKLDLMNALATNAGAPDPALCYQQTGYKSCVMALGANFVFSPTNPVPGTRRTQAQVELNPVTPFSKAITGATDNCSTPQAVDLFHATAEADNGLLNDLLP